MLVCSFYRDVMKVIPKLTTMALAAMLVLSVVAPAALAATAAENTGVDVETDDAENVTNSSAELYGEVEGLDDNESATIYFTYWVEGDDDNATDTANETIDNDTEFKATVTGLQNNTTYVYVAKADVNGTTYSGGEATFTTDEEEKDENASDAFGLEVSAFVHSLMEDRDDSERGIGQQVSEFVLANNPAADKIPDHAGPPEDPGNASEDRRQGPPEDKGPDGEQGPSEDHDPDSDDDESDDEDDESSGGAGNEPDR